MSNVIATNRKARRDYEVLETLECGIELKGSEVKSLRDKKMNLDDSFAHLEGGQVTLYNAHISPYEQASYLNVEPTRQRRLLLHKDQIERLAMRVAQRGFTLIPLKAYFNERGFAKIEVGLCKGKKLYDRRQDLKKRESELAVRRFMKQRR